MFARYSLYILQALSAPIGSSDIFINIYQITPLKVRGSLSTQK